MQRTFLLKFALFAAIFMLTACGKQQEVLVIYTTHGKDLVQTYADKFAQQHPGVQVQWLDMGSQDALDRVRSEKANPQADLWWGAPASLFMQAANEGLLQPYRPTWADHVDSTYRDPHDLWYGTFLTPEVIAFNNQKLTHATAPQDWDDLLEPEWKGRIVIRNPLPSGTMRAIFVSMILRFYEKTGTPDAGFEWLRALDANTRSYAADQTLMYLKLARGEGDVTPWNMPDVMLQNSRYHFPFSYNIPRSGSIIVTDCMAIVAGAKHAALAREFYEFVTTPEAFVDQAANYYRIPARNDIPREQLPEWMRAPIPVLPVDWRQFSAKGAEWMKYWDENIRHAGD